MLNFVKGQTKVVSSMHLVANCLQTKKQIDYVASGFYMGGKAEIRFNYFGQSPGLLATRRIRC